MTETQAPLAVRRRVAFAQAVFDGVCTVEEVSGRRCDVDEVQSVLAERRHPGAGRSTDTQPCSSCARPCWSMPSWPSATPAHTGTMHPLSWRWVRDLPWGVTAMLLSKPTAATIWAACCGTAAPSRIPARRERCPASAARHHACCGRPLTGHVEALVEIGDRVSGGQLLAVVHSQDGVAGEVMAPFDGVLRGIVHRSVLVQPGHEDRRRRPAGGTPALLHRVRQGSSHRRRRAGSILMTNTNRQKAADEYAE